MLTFREAWYWCELEDSSVAEEPDFSKVPEEKREMVRAKWVKAQKAEVFTQLQLWGPQIPFFGRQPYYKVTVKGAVDG